MTLAIEHPDEELLRRMMAGDEDAFVTLYRRRQGGIFRFALQMSGSPAVAEDIVQETFMTLIRDPKRFDPARGTVSAFLYGIARNYLLRRLQSERAFAPLPDDSGEDGPSISSKAGSSALENPVDALTRAETIEQVRDAVLSLPTNYREVVVLCDLQDMSYEDAAATLGCAIGTVRSRLHRARALLVSKLSDLREPARKPGLLPNRTAVRWTV